MRIYLSGPMTGYPGANYTAFDAARDELQQQGHDVVSPADIGRAAGYDGRRTLTRDEYQHVMRLDLAALLACDACYMLPGWEDSDGANLERDVAMGCGIEVEEWCSSTRWNR